MNNEYETGQSISVTQETWEWLQEIGGYGSENDTILRLLMFHDAYNSDLHHNTRNYLIKRAMTTLSSSKDSSCIQILQKIFSLNPHSISFTIRERRSGMVYPHDWELMITFYNHKSAFCLAYLTWRETGNVTIYIPENARKSQQNEGFFVTEEKYQFSGWKPIGAISCDEERRADDIIRPVREIFNGLPSAMIQKGDQNGDDIAEAFWENFIRKVQDKDATVFSNCKPKKNSWRLVAGGGVTGTAFECIIQKNSIIISYRVSKKGKIPSLFSKLKESQDEIEKVYGGSLVWIENEMRQIDYIRIKLPNKDRLEEERWPEVHEEIIEKTEQLKNAIAPIIERITREEMHQRSRE